MRPGIEEARELVRLRLSARKYSACTVKAYESALDFFAAYLRGTGKNGLGEADRKTLEAYAEHLLAYRTRQGKALAPATVRQRLTCLRKTYEMLVREELVFADPFSGFAYGEPERHLPRDVMTAEEIGKLFALPDLGTCLGYRDRTVMETLYGTGLRIGELVALEIADIDFGERLLVVRRGKGGKGRLVPCTRAAFAFLQEYLTEVRPILTCLSGHEQAVFVTAGGRRMDIQCARVMLKRYLKRLGLAKRITAHSFRHTFATHMLQGGAAVRYVQEILGHESLSTTQIYTHVAIRDLREEVRKYHPLENELKLAYREKTAVREKLRRYFKY